MKLGIRRADTELVAVRPLVVPVTPVPGESLAGLVARSTRLNVLRRPRIILSEVGIEALGAGTIAIDVDGIEDRLAVKIGCSTEDVVARATPFVAGPTGREVRHAGGTLSRADLDLRHRWISPATLADRDAHLSAWTHRLLPYCPVSLERLISRCVECAGRLGWVSAWGIGTCEHCRAVVAHPDGERLDHEKAAGYRTFARLVSSDPDGRAAVLAGLTPEIAALPSPVLIRLILGLGRNCRSDIIPHHNVGLMSPTEIAGAVSLGTELIHDFPRRFRAAVVEQIDRIGWEHELPLRPLLSSLRSLGARNLERPEQAELIRAAIPEVFQTKARALGGLRAPVMLFRDIFRLTSITTKRMKPILESGAIQVSMAGGGLRPKAQYDQANAMDFITRLKDSEGSSAVEQLLGIPRYGIEQLICLEELSEENHPAIAILHPGLRIAGPAGYLRRLTSAAKPDDPPHGTLPLARAIRRIGGRAKPWGTILKGLGGGTIDFWFTADDRGGPRAPFSKRAMILPGAIDRFDEVFFDESAHPGFGRFATEVTQLDACDLLNLDSSQMSKVAAAGGLTFHKGRRNSLAIPKREVLRLAETMVSPAELCLRSGVHPFALGKFMAARTGVSRVHMGWSRVDFVREMPGIAPSAESFAGSGPSLARS